MRSMTCCINLPDSEDRRRAFSRSAAKHGVRFEWWPAVDGRKATRERMEQLSVGMEIRWESRGPGVPLSTAEVGCALSHRTLWNHAKNLDLDHLVVFEDDAVPCRALDLEVPDGVDMLFIGARVAANERGEAWGEGRGTEAYVVGRRGLDKLLALFTCLDQPLDLQMMAHIESMIRYGHPAVPYRREGVELLVAHVREGYAWYDRSRRSTIVPGRKVSSRWIANLRRFFR